MGEIAIEVVSTLKTDLQPFMHVIEDVMSDRDGKAQ